jgi:hypothetical protein
VSDGVEIEIASGRSTIRNSPIKIGDISGGDLTKIEVGKDPGDNLTQRILDELSDAKQRIRTIEQYIGGSQLGEPGLTIQVKDLKADIRRIEKEVEFAAALDARIANMEALLISYTRNNVSIDKWVFLAVVGLLFLAIPAVFLILWLGRGGGL